MKNTPVDFSFHALFTRRNYALKRLMSCVGAEGSVGIDVLPTCFRIACEITSFCQYSEALLTVLHYCGYEVQLMCKAGSVRFSNTRLGSVGF